jgi:hypothetical protein
MIQQTYQTGIRHTILDRGGPENGRSRPRRSSGDLSDRQIDHSLRSSPGDLTQTAYRRPQRGSLRRWGLIVRPRHRPSRWYARACVRRFTLSKPIEPIGYWPWRCGRRGVLQVHSVTWMPHARGWTSITRRRAPPAEKSSGRPGPTAKTVKTGNPTPAGAQLGLRLDKAAAALRVLGRTAARRVESPCPARAQPVDKFARPRLSSRRGSFCLPPPAGSTSEAEGALKVSAKRADSITYTPRSVMIALRSATELLYSASGDSVLRNARRKGKARRALFVCGRASNDAREGAETMHSNMEC